SDLSTEFSGKWNRPIGLNEKTGKTQEDRNGGPENSGRTKREAPGSGHKKSAFRKDAKKRKPGTGPQSVFPSFLTNLKLLT
uniref:hypothetical protein n=1 Tax=Alistipes shahii TaxID=328814 RepID=UPI003078DB87